ncbi:MAG: hypothetical protein ABI670_02155 [Chloroflexota bacterium]
MNRNIYILAATSFVIVALATPFQLFSVPLAPIAAIVLGAGAGWWMISNSTEQGGLNGLKAGAVVGAGALLGSIVGLAVLALFVGNIPEVQTYVQNSEPNPEARIPTEWIAPLGALAGVVVGFVVGLFDLVLSAIAGFVAGALNHSTHPTHA